MHGTGSIHGGALCAWMPLYPDAQSCLLVGCLVHDLWRGIFPEGCHWRNCRHSDYDSSPIWYSTWLVQQRVGTGFSPHCCRCGTDQESRAPGSCELHWHILGYRSGVRNHRTCNRHKHNRPPQHQLSGWWHAHKESLWHDSLCGSNHSHPWHSHICILHYLGMVLLWRTRHGIPCRQAQH